MWAGVEEFSCHPGPAVLPRKHATEATTQPARFAEYGEGLIEWAYD